MPKPTARLLARMKRGTTRAQVNGEAMATTTDVRYLYRTLLGREPDRSGEEHFAELLRQQPMSLSDLFEQFARSEEFRNRLDDMYAWQVRSPQRVELADGGYIFVAQEGDRDISGAIRANRTYEPEVSAAIRNELSVGSCFIDVGASIGYFTLLAAGLVGASGRVIACEPGSQNLSLLLLNVADHALGNVEVVPFAASERREILGYDRFSSNGAIKTGSVSPEALAVGDLVQAVPLDEILADAERVDLMKIDVEGAEGKVLRGATETIEKWSPTLVFEFTPAALETVSGLTGTELLELLHALGYRFDVVTRAANPAHLACELTPPSVMRRFDDLALQHIDVIARHPDASGTVGRA